MQESHSFAPSDPIMSQESEVFEDISQSCVHFKGPPRTTGLNLVVTYVNNVILR